MIAAPITIALALPDDVAAKLRQPARMHPDDLEKLAASIAIRLQAAPKASTVPQLAARLGRSKAFVYQQIQKGLLKATRPGGAGELMVTAEAEGDWLAGGSPC